MNFLDPLRRNLDDVRRRIAEACARARRDPAVVQLIVVTKGVPAEIVAALPQLEVGLVGENRVQEAEAKIPEAPGLRWHLVGSLQKNKAKKAAQLFETVHSLDRIELAEGFGDRPLQAFIQVNVSGEPTKHGVRPEDIRTLIARLRLHHPSVMLLGLMTIAPASNNPESSRPHFVRLRQSAAECGLVGLSMGMSQDLEVAVEEGATHVRVGTAIFRDVVGP
jgi:pyridoxal phosphate enzyme (YggS family)